MAKVEKDINVSEVIKRRKYNLAVKQGYISLLIRVILFAVIGYILFSYVFLLMRNTGLGMFPAIKDGDLVLANRLENDYEKEDVVVYEIDGVLTLGRIVACENETVTLNDGGTLRVNGTVQSGEIMYPTYAKEGIEYPYQVPEGCVFILGDYRTRVEDSRDIGAIRLEDIKGNVMTLLRRRGI